MDNFDILHLKTILLVQGQLSFMNCNNHIGHFLTKSFPVNA